MQLEGDWQNIRAVAYRVVYDKNINVNQCLTLQIIQSTPGIGKTTVITAILERLSEISDKTNLKAGQVLITSLQHDAVQNVIKRNTIDSLPTIKFGKRHQNDSQDFEIAMTSWRESTLGKLGSVHTIDK